MGERETLLMADAKLKKEPWRRRRRIGLFPSSAASLFLALSALLALSRGCLSGQYDSSEQPATEQQQQQQQQHQSANTEHPRRHHHIFSSKDHTHARGKNRHPRVPQRRDACDPHSVPARKRCAYVTEQRSCEAAGGRVPYTRLWFCLVFGDEEEEPLPPEGEGAAGALPPPAAGGNSSSWPSTPSPPPEQQQQQPKAARAFSLPAAALLLLGALLWAAALLSLLAVVSSSFLAPAVQWVATALRVPPALAGVTLLALAGGAPDLATEIAAVLSRDYGGFGSSDFEMVFEDGSPAPPLTPAERAAMLKDASAIVADDLGMGVAVALGSSLATLCCGLAAIGWFARSRSGNGALEPAAAAAAVAGEEEVGGGRSSRSRGWRWPSRRNSSAAADEGDAAADAAADASQLQSCSPGIAVEDARAFARDVAAYVLAVVALGAALFDGALGLFESLGLLAAYLVYVAASVLGSRASEAETRRRERGEEAARAEEEREEAAEEGSGGGFGFEEGAKKQRGGALGSPSPSIEMTSSSSSVLRQQLPPRSPVRSPFRGGHQQGSNGGGAFAAAAFSGGGTTMRAVAAPRRRASTDVGDAYGPAPSPSSNPHPNLRVVAPPPTPSGGFFGATLRNLLVGGGGGGGAVGGAGGGADIEESRTPLLSPPSEVTSAALASAFSEPFPFQASQQSRQQQQQQQQRNRSRSPVGRLTRLPRRLSSAGGAEEGGEAEAAAATTTGFSLSPNGAAAPLALEMTSAATAASATAAAAEDENDAAATRPRARKGAAAAPLSAPPPRSGRAWRPAAAARAAADDLFPASLPASVRLLLAALVAPVAAALHCTMPAFGEEGEGGGGAAVAAEPPASPAEEAAPAAVSPPPPPLPLLPPPPPAVTPPLLLSLPRAAILCACAPLAAALLLGATPTAAGGLPRFALSALGGAAALALAFAPYFWRSRGAPVPLRCAASAALALALSGAWLAAAADEAVDLARALARAARLPSELAGGLLLGAGEALPDVAATAALARAAARASAAAAAAAVAAAASAAAASSSSSSRPTAAARARARAAAAAAKAAEAPARIALGATFGAPVFNLLVGLPLPAAIAALRAGWSSGGGGGGGEEPSSGGQAPLRARRVPLPARLTNGALALGSASVVALALLSVALPSRLCRWRVGRSVAAGAAAVWVAALAVFAAVEVGGGGEAVPSARAGASGAGRINVL